MEDRNVFRMVLICLLYFREMCLWDVDDGRCIEFTKLACAHTGIQVSTGVPQSSAGELQTRYHSQTGGSLFLS